MKKSSRRVVRYVIGFSLAVIAVSNCFNAFSNSSTPAGFPVADALRAERINGVRANSGLASFAGSTRAESTPESLILNRAGEAGALTGLASRASAFSPFAPNITATKSHAPAGSAQPGNTLTYTVVIANSGSTDATGVNFSDTIDPNTTLVSGSVKASPIAVDDSYHTIGNVNIAVPAAQGVVANDSNSGFGTLTVTQVNATPVPGTASTANGSVTMNSDGSFSYTPNAAFRGPTDSFTYKLDNGSGSTDTATVTIAVNGLIWFVDSSAAPGGDGRLSTPFNCLVGAGCFDPAAADIANDNIFVYTGAYTGGLTLLSAQKLIGQGAGDTLINITALTQPSGTNLLPSTGGTPPTIAAAGANITLGSGNTIRGVTLNGTAPAAVDLTGTGFGTATIAETSLGGVGQALNLSSGTLTGPVASTAAFTSISSTGSSTTGVSLTTVAGNMSSGATSITTSAGIGISVNTSSAAFNFGTTSSTVSGGTGVSLTSNTGAITFGALTITPSVNQRGLLATENSQTITTTSGSITTSGAAAVEITRSSGTTPLVISLTSVSASGGSSGIFLKNTNGSFTVTGDGGASNNGSGGTIALMTGADASPVDSATVGVGVYLNNVTNVSLNRMNLHDFSNYAIIGTTVTGLTLTRTTINGLNGTNQAGVGEGTVYFNGLNGSATISNCDFSGGAFDTFHVFNNTGQTLNRITITSCSFAMTNIGGNDALVLQATGGTLNATVQSSTITAARSDLFQLNLIGTVTSDLVFGGATGALGNTLTNSNTNIASGGGGVTIGGGSPTNNITLTYSISHNSFKGAHGAVLAVTKGTGTNCSFTGTIDNNTIGTSGVNGSGSTEGEGIAVFQDGAGTSSATIANNQVFGVVGTRGAIDVFVHNGAAGQLTAVVQGNSIGTLDQLNSFSGMYLQTGSNGGAGGDNNKSCLTIGGAGALKNTIDLGGNVFDSILAGIILEQEGVSRVGLLGSPNYSGGPYDDSAVMTFVAANNTVTNPGSALDVFAFHDGSSPAGGGFFGACPPLLFALGGVNRNITDLWSTMILNPSSTCFAFIDTNTVVTDSLSQKELDTVVASASERWSSTGLTPQQLSALRKIRFEVADLPGSYLGQSLDGVVLVDRRGDGKGWYTDASPLSDASFARVVSTTRRYTDPASAPAGRIDLLTQAMHEMGHHLGLSDYYDQQHRDNVMYGYLTVGERRLPTARLSSGVVEASEQPNKVSGPLAASAATTSQELNAAGQSAGVTNAALQGDDAAADTPARETTLRAARGKAPVDDSIQKLTREQLNEIVRAALGRWSQAGISGEDLRTMQGATFEIANLPEGEIASAASAHIKIDETGAGYGWYIDQFASEDNEFDVPVPGKEMQTTEHSPAHGRMDLLTVVMRELGAVYLQGKDRVPKQLRPLMEPTLSPSVRRVPVINLVDRSTSSVKSEASQSLNAAGVALPSPSTNTSVAPVPAIFNPTADLMPGSYGRNAKRMSYATGARSVAAPFSGETVTLNVGTIPAGKSVTVTFQVTVNNPFPNGVCNVTNQGHVTGSNFSQVDTNIDVTPINKAVTISACPLDISTNTGTGVCTAVVTYTTPTGDGCPAPTVTCIPASGSAFNKGTTTVTCTASNGVSPDQSCTFTVTVTDNEPPTVTCPSPISANTGPGVCTAAVTYTTPAGHDNCPGVTVNCTPASGSTFNKGVTTVTCTATDAGSLTGTCTFTVTVVDNQSPTIGSCPAPITTSTAPNVCSAVVTYATPSASDNCPGVTVGCSPSSGSVFMKGTTTVTCTATDTSSHTASCSFTVTVEDHQPPSITCPGNVNTTENSPGSGCATVTYTTPTPSDNCPGATAMCAPPSGTCFAIGTTTVTCTAMDTSANTSQCQFTVTVTAIGLTSLSPAKMWIGLKNSDDVGTKFDLLAEVLRNGSVVGSGQLNDVPGGGSGFNNAVLRTITLALSSPVPIGPGDTMSFRLSVRIAATSGHNSGTARLWYNGQPIDSGASRDAGSRFDATIAGSTSDYFLRTSFQLNTVAGSSRTSIDKLASNSGGNPWVAFGTWSKTF